MSAAHQTHSLSLEMLISTVNVNGISVQVPSLLADCFAYILSDALVEGIFRVSGSARRMKLVSSDYSQYQGWLHSTEKKPNVHDVAGVIKKYLREYLDSIDGLFSPSCLLLLHRLYLAHLRCKSDGSINSFKSAETSLVSDSTLPSVVEHEATEIEVSDPESLLDSVAHLLITKNHSSNNEFFIYLLLQLKQLSLHEDKTKMSIPNLSIIFQPYIFSTQSLSELRPFQGLLTLLVLHYHSFIQKYLCYKTIVGGLEELDAENISITSSESLTTSPLTVYSSHPGSPSKNGGSAEIRRKSISQRFSIFWDSYNLPANRSKRFSLNFGSKSSEKVFSTENLAKERRPEAAAVCPHELLKSNESLNHGENESEHKVREQCPQATSSPKAASVSVIQLPIETSAPTLQRPLLTKRSSSKLKSLIGLFKSSLSVNSIPSPVQQEVSSPYSVSISPLTSPATNMGFSTKDLNASVDDLLSSQEANALV